MADQSDPPEALPFPKSLCHRCCHSKIVGNRRGSRFLMCRAQPVKYLPQPVLQCGYFEAKAGAR